MDEEQSLKPAAADREEEQLEHGELPAKRSRSRSISPGARDYKRRYGRSRSPAGYDTNTRDRRRRSRSRDRDRHRPRKDKSGFKWKEKANNDDADSRGGRLERGYRDQGLRERNRDRGGDYDWDRRREGNDGRDNYRRERSDRDGSRREDDRETDRHRGSRDFRDERRAFKEGEEREMKDKLRDPDKAKDSKKEKREKKTVIQSSQTMIVVYVNDRLGTKAGIPCLPSDPIKLFKAQVAARIGREPHEIMLKRQGERPFKDQLTLEDYGVSNGVQLDLELDTGE